MQTVVLGIEYDGTNYKGWQRQKNAPSIQQKIEEAVSAILGSSLPVVGGGRTDTGVHARGQVAHFYPVYECKIPAGNLQKALNSKLPADISIKKIAVIEGKFHARFDAIAREYSYTISLDNTIFDRRYTFYPGYNFDIGLLLSAASLFCGSHNFTTFSKSNPDTKNYFCNVEICKWKSTRRYLRLRIKSDRFVYGMVRSVTGAMLDISRGKRTIEEVAKALDKADRRLISPLAPPNGLVLEKIYYSKKFKIFS